MATVKEVVLEHHKRADGTWNVKIRVTQGNQSSYIPTQHFVTVKQLKKDFTLKDTFIIDDVSGVLADYRRKISALGMKALDMSSKELASFLSKKETGSVINFGKFCRDYIKILRNQDKTSSANNLNTVYNSIVDFLGTTEFMASDINSTMLARYESFLKTEREMTRPDKNGKDIKIKKPPLTSSVHNYMRDLRRLFNAARNKYNDEDTGVTRIAHYPFRKYKIGSAPTTKKRNLTINQLKLIRDAKIEKGGRAELARDLFMLSFYLCGMNAKDFYVFHKVKSGRVDYNRSKTLGKRKDKAFISIKVPDNAMPIIEKFLPSLHSRYATSNNLNAALRKGLIKVVETIDEALKQKSIETGTDLKSGLEGLTFYHARHSFGNLARNKCRFSKDDIALAMNHVDQERKTTDIYIEPDWSIVDEVQAGVLALLND